MVILFIVVRRGTLFLILAGLMIAGLLFAFARPDAAPVFAAEGQGRGTVVIDPGHGGEDGGAVSPDGVAESHINLAVALALDDLLRFLGEDSVMTRREDVSIYSAGARTLREKKVSDLKNRAALVNGTENAVLISIHQNSLPSAPRVHGAQVFYGAGGEGLAASAQETLNKMINADNAKSEKAIDSTIYLMNHVNCPAILVECGFLSNAEETVKLQDPAYQTRLAAAVAAGYLQAARAEEETP